MDDAVVLPIYYTTQPYIAQPYVKIIAGQY